MRVSPRQRRDARAPQNINLVVLVVKSFEISRGQDVVRLISRHLILMVPLIHARFSAENFGGEVDLLVRRLQLRGPHVQRMDLIASEIVVDCLLNLRQFFLVVCPWIRLIEVRVLVFLLRAEHRLSAMLYFNIIKVPIHEIATSKTFFEVGIQFNWREHVLRVSSRIFDFERPAHLVHS